MKIKVPWMRNRKRSLPDMPDEPPIWFGPWSNGEYFKPVSHRTRLLRKAVLQKADENARRLGMDRREFLATSMGMCTTLWVINQAACSSSTTGGSSNQARDGGGGSGGSDSGSPGGLCVPMESMLDPEAACESIGSKGEFIFDVQTHWFKEEDLAKFDLYRTLFSSLFAVTKEDNYITNMFLDSDTTVAVLTAWPGVSCKPMRDTCGLPLSNESIVASRNRINMAALKTQRVVNHTFVMAQDNQDLIAAGEVVTRDRAKELLADEIATMEAMCTTNGLAGWKMYPGAFPPGYQMTDERARLVVEKGLELGVPIFCVHKGLPIGPFFDPITNYPSDIGPIAKEYPDAKFVIYHSGICSGYPQCGSVPGPEGPYDETSPLDINASNRLYGTNALIRSLLDNGIKPNSNVYAEVGSAMNEVRDDPIAAQHFFGKLLKYVGEDRVVWGTDCVIYGSPQQFIDWFRALEISTEFQDKYGYPALTAEVKAKVFGLNAARLYGIDPDATRCAVDQSMLAQYRRDIDGERGARRWSFRQPNGPQDYATYARAWAEATARGRPG